MAVDATFVARAVEGIFSTVTALQEYEKNKWLPTAPKSIAPALGWLKGKGSDAVDDLMGRIEGWLGAAASAADLNEVIRQLAVYTPTFPPGAGVESGPAPGAGGEAAAAPADNLTGNLLTLSVHLVRNRWPARARSSLLALLCERCLADLDARSRALLVHVLAQLGGLGSGGGGGASSRAGLHVRRLLTSGVGGGDFVRLKQELDASGDYHNLHKLVFRDLAADDTRAFVLAFAAAEGGAFRDRAEAGEDGTRLRPWRKVHHHHHHHYHPALAESPSLGLWWRHAPRYPTSVPARLLGVVWCGTSRTHEPPLPLTNSEPPSPLTSPPSARCPPRLCPTWTTRRGARAAAFPQASIAPCRPR